MPFAMCCPDAASLWLHVVELARIVHIRALFIMSFNNLRSVAGAKSCRAHPTTTTLKRRPRLSASTHYPKTVRRDRGKMSPDQKYWLHLGAGKRRPTHEGSLWLNRERNPQRVCSVAEAPITVCYSTDGEEKEGVCKKKFGDT